MISEIMFFSLFNAAITYYTRASFFNASEVMGRVIDEVRGKLLVTPEINCTRYTVHLRDHPLVSYNTISREGMLVSAVKMIAEMK